MRFPRALVLYPDYFLSDNTEMRFLDRYLNAVCANTPYQIMDPKRSVARAVSLQTMDDTAAILSMYGDCLEQASALFFMPLPPTAALGEWLAPISVTTAKVIDLAWEDTNTSRHKPVFEIIPQPIWHQPLIQPLTPEILAVRRINLTNTQFLESIRARHRAVRAA